MPNGKWVAEGKVLGELIDSRYEERLQFAQDMGVSDNIVSNWVRGVTRLRGERRKKAAKLLGVPESSLRPVAPPKEPETSAVHERQAVYNIGTRIPVARSGYRLIPIYGAIPAGNPATSYSQATEILEEPDWGTGFDRWGHPVVGDSMLDEFREGDIVIFENRAWKSGHAVHARREGEETFKVAIKENEGTPLERLDLWPMNDAFEPIDGADWEVLGVCIERRRELGGGVTDIRRYKSAFTWRFRQPQ